MAKFSIPPPVGCTRLCLDPWSKTFIRADLKVCLCCHSPPVGTLEDSTLEEVLNNSEATAYREGLLSGHLKPACQSCPDRKIVTIEEAQTALITYLQLGEIHVF